MSPPIQLQRIPKRKTTKPATERAFLFQEFAVLKTIATWVLTAIGTLAFLTLQAVLDGR